VRLAQTLLLVSIHSIQIHRDSLRLYYTAKALLRDYCAAISGVGYK